MSAHQLPSFEADSSLQQDDEQRTATMFSKLTLTACLTLAVASSVFSAPTFGTQHTDEKSLGSSLIAPQVPVVPAASGSASHHQSAFDKGAHQTAASSGQGSSAYDHGAQASKAFGNKESSGSKENYAFAANNAFNQGSGSFSHTGGFNNAAQLANAQLGSHFQQSGLPGAGLVAPGVASIHPGLVLPVIPPTGIATSSSAGGLQQGSTASGHAQGQGSWAYNQGQSSVNSSGNKETFSNKESFGADSSAAHATGAAQNAHAQSSQAGHHEKGHQVNSANQGTTIVG